MAHIQNQANAAFHDLIDMVLMCGKPIPGRNGNTRRIAFASYAFSETPLVSLRKTAWRNAILEWEWFMSGSENINDLDPRVRHWWEPFVGVDKSTLFYNYGHAFRRGSEIDYHDRRRTDQVQIAIDTVKEHPYSRRNVITTWIPEHVHSGLMNPTNCHGTSIQLFCDQDNVLSMGMFQRSCDVVLGLQHNWLQYWAFLLWLARETDKTPGHFHWVGGDVHIYEAHLGVAEHIHALSPLAEVPSLVISPEKGPFRAADFSLDGQYVPLLTEPVEMLV